MAGGASGSGRLIRGYRTLRIHNRVQADWEVVLRACIVAHFAVGGIVHRRARSHRRIANSGEVVLRSAKADDGVTPAHGREVYAGVDAMHHQVEGDPFVWLGPLRPPRSAERSAG